MKFLNGNTTKSWPCTLKYFHVKSVSTISKISEILDKFLKNCKYVLTTISSHVELQSRPVSALYKIPSRVTNVCPSVQEK